MTIPRSPWEPLHMWDTPSHNACTPMNGGFPADPVRFVCFRPVSSPCEAASFPRDTGRTGRGWTGSESSPHGID
ncbi:unnamed protein product [Gadus morhua 'NCC']